MIINFFNTLKFFSEDHNDNFTTFSITHFIKILIILVFGFVFIKISKKWGIKNQTSDKLIRYSLAFSLIFIDLIYQMWNIHRNGLNIKTLPLNLCDIVCYLTSIALLKNNHKIASIIYYWALPSTTLAILFPSIKYSPMHFRFFHYFFVHFAQTLGCLYFFITKKIYLSNSKNIKSITILFFISLIMLFLDLLSGQNWFYMVKSPIENISGFLGFPLYTICWMLFIISFMRISYFVTKFFFTPKKNS